MKRFFSLISCLALASACSGAPAVQASSQLASSPTDAGGKPVATSGGPSAAVDGASGVAPASAAAYREVTLPDGTILPVDLETTSNSRSRAGSAAR